MRRQITAHQMLDRIVTAFDKRQWKGHQEFAAEVVRRETSTHVAPDANRMSQMVPRAFLTVNGISRSELAELFHSLFCETEIIGQARSAHAIEMRSDLGNERIEIVKNKFEINNQGQISGNFGSENSAVFASQHQQAVSAYHELELREQMEDSEIRDLLSSTMPDDEKKVAIGHRLAELTGTAVEVAIPYVAKFIREFSS